MADELLSERIQKGLEISEQGTGEQIDAMYDRLGKRVLERERELEVLIDRTLKIPVLNNTLLLFIGLSILAVGGHLGYYTWQKDGLEKKIAELEAEVMSNMASADEAQKLLKYGKYGNEPVSGRMVVRVVEDNGDPCYVAKDGHRYCFVWVPGK